MAATSSARFTAWDEIIGFRFLKSRLRKNWSGIYSSMAMIKLLKNVRNRGNLQQLNRFISLLDFYYRRFVMQHRRDILKSIGFLALPAKNSSAQPVADHPHLDAGAVETVHTSKADYVIKIATGIVDLGRGVSVSTTLYNDQFPGPLLRLEQGKPITVDIVNDTDRPEQLHWHGLFLPTDVDGSAEEGTPFIPARGKRRISFTPDPTGFRFFHSHTMAGPDLSAGLYSGQFGLVYIEPMLNAGRYDQEVFLTLKEFSPFFSQMEMNSNFLDPSQRSRALLDIDLVAAAEAKKLGRGEGHQVSYSFKTINGKHMGELEPIRVKQGERVLFHVVNASATDVHSLHLPGHVFRVIALDGNAVPNEAEVPVLWIAPGERISATVEMNTPGTWAMADLDHHTREGGMGIIVEYAGETNATPSWGNAPQAIWDYRNFARPGAKPTAPDETLDLLIGTRYQSREGFDEFTLNGKAFSMETMEPTFHLHLGRRYRLRVRNATDDTHPIHIHRTSFEITSFAGKPTSGVIKDVVMAGPYRDTSIDFTASAPGLSLLHCHMQHHMDYGFMALFKCD